MMILPTLAVPPYQLYLLLAYTAIGLLFAAVSLGYYWKESERRGRGWLLSATGTWLMAWPLVLLVLITRRSNP